MFAMKLSQISQNNLDSRKNLDFFKTDTIMETTNLTNEQKAYIWEEGNIPIQCRKKRKNCRASRITSNDSDKII